MVIGAMILAISSLEIMLLTSLLPIIPDYFTSGGTTTAGIWPVGAMAASGLCTNCGCTVVVDAKSSTVGFGVAFIGGGTGCTAGAAGCWVAATTVGSTESACCVSC